MKSEPKIKVGELRIGSASVSFEIPSVLFDVAHPHLDKCTDVIKLYSFNSDTILGLIRSLIPAEERPPSVKQIAYAEIIADTLLIDLSEEVYVSALACSDFIELFVDSFKEVTKQQQRETKERKENRSQAYRVAKWLSVKEDLLSGICADRLAEVHKVQPPTIYRYVQQLEDWFDLSKRDGSFNKVMDLVKEIRSQEQE